jgi:hypothetical protein
MSPEEIVNRVTQAALEACDGDVGRNDKALWYGACSILADVLRHADELGRERLLRDLVPELRDSVTHLDELLQPAPYPRTPEQVH